MGDIFTGLFENGYMYEDLKSEGYENGREIIDGEGVLNQLRTYYGVEAPEGNSWPMKDAYGQPMIEYKNGKYYVPETDFESTGMDFCIATDIMEAGNGIYQVSYVKYWVEPGYMTYDEENMMLLNNKDGYYDYTVEDAENDKFCEKRDEGQTLVRRNPTTGQLNIVLDR